MQKTRAGLWLIICILSLLNLVSCQECTQKSGFEGAADVVIPYVRVKYSETKQCRGVFALKDFAEGDVIEHAPVLYINLTEGNSLGVMYDYIFDHPDDENVNILALGYLSLFNHEEDYNVEYNFDLENDVIITTANRPIKKGEEMTVHYGHDWWTERPEYKKF